MVIKARYVDGKFIPLGDNDLGNIDSGEVVELDVTSKKDEIKWKGALKHIKKSSVELQHEIKNIW